jgi:hypothetical protein
VLDEGSDITVLDPQDEHDLVVEHMTGKVSTSM